MAVNLIIEKGLLDTKRDPGRMQEMPFEHFHCSVVLERCLAEFPGSIGPQVGNEIALALSTGVVLFIGPAVGADVVELLEVRLGWPATGAPQRFAGERAVTAWGPRNRMLGPEFLL